MTTLPSPVTHRMILNVWFSSPAFHEIYQKTECKNLKIFLFLFCSDLQKNFRIGLVVHWPYIRNWNMRVLGRVYFWSLHQQHVRWNSWQCCKEFSNEVGLNTSFRKGLVSKWIIFGFVLKKIWWQSPASVSLDCGQYKQVLILPSPRIQKEEILRGWSIQWQAAATCRNWARFTAKLSNHQKASSKTNFLHLSSSSFKGKRLKPGIGIR